MSTNNNIKDNMKKTASTDRVDSKPDATSRNERDATHDMLHGRGSLAQVRTAMDRNTVSHKSSPELRKSKR
jgi:hypothetical protein